MQMNMQTSLQQKQTITADLIQNLELLQLSSTDIWEYVQEKVLENPLLEMNPRKIEKDILKRIANRIQENGNHVQFANPIRVKQGLIDQIPLKQSLTKKQRNILDYLIDSLDDRLFLNVDVDEVAALFRAEKNEVKRMIHILQSFEPFGIGQQNSMEFMIFQLKQLTAVPTYVFDFIKDDLSAIAKREITYLMSKYKLNRMDVVNAIQIVKSLQPFPIQPTADDKIQYIVPDIEIKKVNHELWIEINQNALPNVLFNISYMNLLKEKVEFKEYYKECLKTARTLISGIEERKKTLIKIMHLLVEKQQAFFEHDKNNLIPLNISDVASELGLHESTISRAIREKYFIFENKIYPLKFLFQKGIQTKNESVTTDFIKRQVQFLIENENPHRPLSDQRIVELLKKENIHVARRTITKYREELFIPSSKNRKK